MQTGCQQYLKKMLIKGHNTGRSITFLNGSHIITLILWEAGEGIKDTDSTALVTIVSTQSPEPWHWLPDIHRIRKKAHLVPSFSLWHNKSIIELEAAGAAWVKTGVQNILKVVFGWLVIKCSYLKKYYVTPHFWGKLMPLWSCHVHKDH